MSRRVFSPFPPLVIKMTWRPPRVTWPAPHGDLRPAHDPSSRPPAPHRRLAIVPRHKGPHCFTNEWQAGQPTTIPVSGATQVSRVQPLPQHR